MKKFINLLYTLFSLPLNSIVSLFSLSPIFLYHTNACMFFECFYINYQNLMNSISISFDELRFYLNIYRLIIYRLIIYKSYYKLSLPFCLYFLVRQRYETSYKRLKRIGQICAQRDDERRSCFSRHDSVLLNLL